MNDAGHMSHSMSGAPSEPTRITVDQESATMEPAEVSETSERVKRVVVAAVLAALSVAAAPIATYLPRIGGWGIALFDPVSIFWIAAFLIGGIWVGMISTIAGTLGLFFTDPTGIGPIFKFLATLPMIVIPWFAVRMFGRGRGGSYLSAGLNYAFLMSLAYVVRLIVMIPLNLVVVPLFAPWMTADQIAAYTFLINTIQSFWDALVPYVVVFPSMVFRHFKMW